MNVIPLPNKCIDLKKKISFSNYEIIIANKYQNGVLHFNHQLEEHLKIDEKKKPFIFEFEIARELKKQEYHIKIQDDIALITASCEYGFYLASNTLIQLMNIHYGPVRNKIEFNAYDIEDEPFIEFRSFMLDESRHFFGKEEVYKLIDVLSLLKFNYFHWHLSDDQGFRIDFKTFPRLKEIAAKRERSLINSEKYQEYDEHEYYHYYTYQDIKDVINYAKKHYIEIIPEIDMPGHTSALIAAYNDLHCFNQKCKTAETFGVFYKDVMCLGKDSTYTFAFNLLDELCNLFSSSKYIHIGGDEVVNDNYKICPDCQNKIKELKLKDEVELQAYFSNMLANHLMNKGKKVIMWHDGVKDSSDDDIIMQYWDWQMVEKSINYINEGRKCIYSPCSQNYFNDPYAELPLSTTYNRGIKLDGLTKIENIIGMECNIWTEWIDSNAKLEFNLFPRLQAQSESTWTFMINKDYDNFIERVKQFDKYLDEKNIVHAPLEICNILDENYKKEISGRYRDKEKDVEFKMLNKK